MQVYKTRDGDVLDGIMYEAYGSCTNAMLRAVLAANPGIADRGAVLPAGISVNLPDNVASDDSQSRRGVTLWE